MAYATQQQLIDRYGAQMVIDLSDRQAPPANVIDAVVVARAIADTTALIDGYLATRYTLPLTAVPDLVTDLALQIAIYKLHAQTVGDKVRADYEAAVRLLREIAAGALRIPAGGLEPAVSGAQGVQTNDRERPFTSENLKGFI